MEFSSIDFYILDLNEELKTNTNLEGKENFKHSKSQFSIEFEQFRFVYLNDICFYIANNGAILSKICES